jgi:hypothetical protein
MIKRKARKKLKGPSTLKRFELWYSRNAGYSFFPENNKSARSMLPAGAQLVKVVRAKTWEEAQTKKHQHLRLEPYKPIK